VRKTQELICIPTVGSRVFPARARGQGKSKDHAEPLIDYQKTKQSAGISDAAKTLERIILACQEL
jgi:hypothetical protein